MQDNGKGLRRCSSLHTVFNTKHRRQDKAESLHGRRVLWEQNSFINKERIEWRNKGYYLRVWNRNFGGNRVGLTWEDPEEGLPWDPRDSNDPETVIDDPETTARGPKIVSVHVNEQDEKNVKKSVISDLLSCMKTTWKEKINFLSQNSQWSHHHFSQKRVLFEVTSRVFLTHRTKWVRTWYGVREVIKETAKHSRDKN